MLRLRPLHDALREAVGAASVHTLAEIADQFAGYATAQPVEGEPAADAELVASPTPSVPETIEPDLLLRELVDKSRKFFERILENLPPDDLAQPSRPPTADSDGAKSRTPGIPPQRTTPSGSDYTEAVHTMLLAAAHLPTLAQSYSTDWAAKSRPVLPGKEAATRRQRVWAPILAWIVLRNLPWHRAPHSDLAGLFDRLLLRPALADIFLSMGMEGESRWQAAAEVRLLLTQAAVAPDAIRATQLWADPDARWLAGVNHSSGVTYLNKEQFEELLTWLQLPALIEIARTDGHPQGVQLAALAKVESSVAAARAAATSAGYKLDAYLAPPPTPLQSAAKPPVKPSTSPKTV